MDLFRRCYRCGESGHFKRDCPALPSPPPPQAAEEPDRNDARLLCRRPVSEVLAEYRRAPEEISDPQPWADSIRQAMGWPRDGADERLRELAERQAVESRLARLAFLDEK